MQIVIGGNFNIQPHRRLLLYVAPLLKLGGNGGEIAFQYRKRLGDRYGEILDGVEFPCFKAHQMHAFVFAALVKTESDRRAAVANMLRAADNLRPVNMAQRDVVRRRKFCAGKASSVPI